MRLPEVSRLTGLSRPTIYRYMAKGGFPKNVKLTERTSAWLAAEIEAWLDFRVVQRAFTKAA